MSSRETWRKWLTTSDSALNWAERIARWIMLGVGGGSLSAVFGVVLGALGGNLLYGLVIGVVVGMIILVALSVQAVRVASMSTELQKGFAEPDYLANEEPRSTSTNLQNSLQNDPSSSSGSQGLPFASDQDLSSTYINGKSLYIFDLARHRWIVKNRTFENCFVRGPAVVAVMAGTDFVDCNFTEAGDLNSLTWPVSPGRADHIGAIGLESCIFRNCTFLRVGILANLTDSEGNPFTQ